VKQDDDVIVLDGDNNPRWINCTSIGRYRGIDDKHLKNKAKYKWYEDHSSMDSRKGRKRNLEILKLYNKLTNGGKGHLSAFALTAQALGEFTHQDKEYWKGKGKRGNIARMRLASWIYNHVVLPNIFSTEKSGYDWEEDSKNWKENSNFSVRARTGFENHRKILERMIGQVYEKKKDSLLSAVKKGKSDEEDEVPRRKGNVKEEEEALSEYEDEDEGKGKGKEEEESEWEFESEEEK
jgi:hypothetical protein